MHRMRTTHFPVIILGSLAFWAATGVTKAQTLKPGVYRLVENDAGRPVERTSGGTIRVDGPLTTDLGNLEIWSMSNQNDRYRIYAKKVPGLNLQHRFVIGGPDMAEVVSSVGQNEDGKSFDLIADVVGRDHVERLAEQTGVQIQHREHPGHQLQVTWEPTQDSFEVGKPVTLRLKIENVGKTTVRFIEGGQQRGPRDNQFSFVAFAGSGYGKAVPDTGDPMNFGGIGAFREVKPGDLFEKEVDVTSWFKFEKPDLYQITGIYELEMYDKEFSAKILWHEFATGRCLVRLVSPE